MDLQLYVVKMYDLFILTAIVQAYSPQVFPSITHADEIAGRRTCAS
jgi:hypothetical protein